MKRMLTALKLQQQFGWGQLLGIVPRLWSLGVSISQAANAAADSRVRERERLRLTGAERQKPTS